MHLLEHLVGHDHRGGSFSREDGQGGVLPTPGEESRSQVRVNHFALQ